MVRWCLFVPLFLILISPALAQSRPPQPQGNIPTYNAGSWRGPPNPYAPPPRPAAGPYDRPTLGDPTPRIYGQTPTLGDPRGTRNSNPRTCTGLLCD